MVNRHFLKVTPVLFALCFIWPDAALLAAPHQQLSLRARIQESYQDIVQSHEALAEIVAFMNSRPDLFSKAPFEKQSLLSRDQRMAIWHTWQRFLDHMLALAFLEQHYAALREKEIDTLENDLFCGHYAIFLTQYRYALAFIQIAERNTALHTLLNDPVPNIGLPENTYSELKREFLDVAKAARFAQLDMAYLSRDQRTPELIADIIETDRAFIWEIGKGPGPLLTLKNGLEMVQDTAYKAWFPVQKTVAEWMGNTKVWRGDEYLITQDQILAMAPRLKPGDILLIRREWYLSNIGLPGFWPHSALYVGTPSERKDDFDGDTGVRVWVKMQRVENGDFETLLEKTYPEAYLKNNRAGGPAQVPAVIEATSEGVSLAPLSSAAHADTLAVLRPRLPKVAKARAVFRAFHYLGRPYDFNFDFQTDSKLVCTELIYKAYESEPHIAGLTLPLQDILGRKVTTANDIARLFDEEYGRESRQLDFVLFFDANEARKAAFRADRAAFRESWKRPKWHILVSDSTPPQ